jgi:hypothetical protein
MRLSRMKRIGMANKVGKVGLMRRKRRSRV